MKAELFVAGCRLCNEAEYQYTQRFPELEIEIHRADECTDGSCCRQATQYSLTAVPALVIKGNVVQVGNPTEEELQQIKENI